MQEIIEKIYRVLVLIRRILTLTELIGTLPPGVVWHSYENIDGKAIGSALLPLFSI